MGKKGSVWDRNERVRVEIMPGDGGPPPDKVMSCDPPDKQVMSKEPFAAGRPIRAVLFRRTHLVMTEGYQPTVKDIAKALQELAQDSYTHSKLRALLAVCADILEENG